MDAPIITSQKTTRRANRLPLYSPRIISQEAVNLVTNKIYHQENQRPWLPSSFITSAPANLANNYDVDIEHFCAPVVHPTTGETITQYRKLLRDPITNEVWSTAFGKEWGRMAQGDNKTGEKGTNSIFVMNHEEIKHIPKDRVVTYARIVVDFRAQKTDPNRVRITAGGNLIKYPGELTTRTADLTTSKVIWSSVLSTKDARFMGIDIKNFYLGTPLDRYEYMKLPLSLFPRHTIEQYDLRRHEKGGFVYVEIRRAIYGLPQAGILANKQLRERLAPFGYYEVAHTPGLWRHVTKPVQFSLVVDDFGVKYFGEEHVNHLIRALQTDHKVPGDAYEVEVDWKGDLFCGISLDWHYGTGDPSDRVGRYLDISMIKYIPKLLQKFNHERPKKDQHSPYRSPPKKYGAAAQDPLEDDTTAKISKVRKLRIQKVIGGLLYYARAVDLTILTALSAIASQQASPTEKTELHVQHLLDYIASHPDATVRFYPSSMILNIHSDASYLTEPNGRSRVAGHYFLGEKPKDNEPISLNGAIYAFCGILKIVVTSAAEAELAALFLNAKEGKIIRLILEELGHHQPPTPMHCDNKTATGIANDTVKKQRSRSMEMRFFFITDQVNRGLFDVQWHPGQENLADYYTKHFDARHHQEVRPWYLHMHNSPRILPRAAAPSTLRGCVGTLPNGYIRSSPLPRIGVPRDWRAPPGRVQTVY